MSSPPSAMRSVLQCGDVVDGLRLRDALERHLPHRLGDRLARDALERLLVQQDLARLRLAAQARGEVRDAADASVVPASVEADRAERRVADRDADAEPEVVAALLPVGVEGGEIALHL